MLSIDHLHQSFVSSYSFLFFLPLSSPSPPDRLSNQHPRPAEDRLPSGSHSGRSLFFRIPSFASDSSSISSLSSSHLLSPPPARPTSAVSVLPKSSESHPDPSCPWLHIVFQTHLSCAHFFSSLFTFCAFACYNNKPIPTHRLTIRETLYVTIPFPDNAALAQPRETIPANLPISQRKNPNSPSIRLQTTQHLK